MPKITKQAPVKSRTVKPSGVVLGRLQTAWDVEDYLRMNMYGKSGTGKTTLWSTFPGPILAIICSGGKQPGEMLSVRTPEMRKKITPMIAATVRDVQDLVDVGPDFATVVLDHGTDLQAMCLREILGLEELPAQSSWGLASMQQYGQCSLKVKEILRALLSMPTNVVIVCQERNFNEESDSEVIQPYVASALTPSVAGWLGPACDYVCQTFIRPKVEQIVTKVGGKEVRSEKRVKGQVEYCLRTAPHETYASKFRKPKGHQLPECIVDPTYDKIMELINGG